MWPFDKVKTAAAQSGTGVGVSGTVESAQSSANADAIARLVKRVDAIEMEWMEWFDKFRRLYARLAKRQEREERESLQDDAGATIAREPHRDEVSPIPLHHNGSRSNY